MYMQQKTLPVDYVYVNINGGFWREKQELVSEKTIYAIFESFKKTGRIDAFKFEWKEGQPNKPHIFWDSDVAKWIESAAYILSKKQDNVLEGTIDEIVDLIEKRQDSSGYFNIYFILIEPEAKWKRREAHELYTAGHLIEAALAYYNATGKDKFLKLMCRFVDHIDKVFRIEKSAAFTSPGHEEIELALVKLYRATGERKYLELAKHFVDIRGTQVDPDSPDYDWKKSRQNQDHLPAKKQFTAEGHAVRAGYFYSAMADIAYEYDDVELFNACRALCENIANRRMYITGGVGSSAVGESFTVDYDLPNITAYTETCAAIAMAFFAHRMTMCDNKNSSYADMAEKIIYNGLMSGISLDGGNFFYENPLEIQPYLNTRNRKLFKEDDKRVLRLPKEQRSEVFDCSCCPPNISRFIASFGGYIYTYNKDTFFIDHYVDSTAGFNAYGSDVKVCVKTEYPVNGKVDISILGGSFKKIAIRIPSWCEEYTVNVSENGKEKEISYIPDNGYIYVDYNGNELNIKLDLKMKVQLIESAPQIQENAGRTAVQYGPIIYCLEEVDNGPLLKNIYISGNSKWEVEYSSFFNANILKTKGHEIIPHKDGSLYYNCRTDGRMQEKDLVFIPYFGFANRGVSEMVVWVMIRN